MKERKITKNYSWPFLSKTFCFKVCDIKKINSTVRVPQSYETVSRNKRVVISILGTLLLSIS